ncbi:MAG: hypothetical protein DMG86_13145 [Acidobacteria bacterium]|nr:MAG: hypothetical protein DMG86_13145 [Acidobacteriota bacterium]
MEERINGRVRREYHFQLTCFALSRSPIVGMYGRLASAGLLSFCDGSKLALPGVENVGTRFTEKMVLTA